MSSALLNTMAGRRTFLRLWFDPGIENGGRNGSGFLAIVLKLCLRFELPRSIPCLKLEADCRKLETNRLNLGFLSTAGTTCTGLNEGIGWIGRFWNAGNRTGVVCLDLKFGSLRGRFLSGAFLNGALDLHCLGAAYFPKSLVSREGFKFLINLFFLFWYIVFVIKEFCDHGCSAIFTKTHVKLQFCKDQEIYINNYG